jgi:phage terminase large subunit-like protein
LPGEKGDAGSSETAEIKNTQYPALKKWLPPFLIKKDITFRNPAITIKDPNAGAIFGDLEYKGGDIIIEFVSYNQSTQATAGVQRLSIWCDEEPSADFYKEQTPRLLAENGDFILSLTPANYITWTYDELFERANMFYRSKAICDYLRTDNNEVKQVEKYDSPLDVAVFQAATDDNPTLDLDVIEDMFAIYDDPDDIAIRRYGIFKQVSGRIFKDFEYHTHFIDGSKYFGDGIPHSWTHGRGIDFHPQTPWACIMMALSPTNEAFVWGELQISPEKYTTREICKELSLMGKDYQFRLNLIDPFSAATKKDSITVLDDINRAFHEFKQEGIGTGGYWQTWDTKGEKGRDEIRKRLKNSLHVGKPFNNTIVKDGRKEYLPTLWVLNNCKQTAQSMRQWRWEEWSDPKSRNTKEQKNVPMQKWSHLMMCIEALFKHPAFRPYVGVSYNDRAPGYFRARG